MTLEQYWEMALILAAGLCFGSFVTLASFRLPRDESVVRPGSRCPSCGTQLKPLDLVPVFSWVAHRGRCAHCKTKVHWRYPAIELVQAALFLGIYFLVGPNGLWVVLALLSVCILTLIVTDLEHMIIPDEIQIVMGILSLAYAWLGGIAWTDLGIGAATGLLIGLSLHYGFKWIRKKDGLGFGDVKFLAVAGAWMGVQPMVPFLFFAGLLGIATALVWRMFNKNPQFPFGPALAISMFMCVLFPQITAAFWSIGQSSPPY